MSSPFSNRCLLAGVVFVGMSGLARSQPVFDLRAQWSDAANPNGTWTYREGGNPLPGVASWQSTLGGWSVAQPGWARSENGNNRLPFWYRSNGSETFTHDWVANDIVVHSTDSVNGVGNGPANVLWTSPFNGFVDITGGTWIGRDIGRSNRWNLYHAATLLSSGDTSSGDVFSRANPFDYAAGSGGANVLRNIPVTVGDTITLEIVSIGGGAGGDFQGVNLAITQVVPEPGSLSLVGIAAVAWSFRRRYRGE